MAKPYESVHVVLYTDGPTTDILGVFVDRQDANAACFFQADQIGLTLHRSGTTDGPDDAHMLPIEPMRWDHPEGISCWVEEHSVHPKKLLHHGAGAVPAASGQQADHGDDVDISDKQQKHGVPSPSPADMPPLKKRESSEFKSRDSRRALDSEDLESRPETGGEHVPDDLSRGGEADQVYFKQPLQ